MKKLLAIVTVLLFATQNAFADSKEEFASSYRKAHDSQSVEAFSELIEFSPDTPEWIKNQILESFKADAKLTVTEITFLPLDEKFKASFEYQGVTYIPTAVPIMKMSVKYDESTQGRAKVTRATYTIGEISGKLRIVSAKPKKE
jgi:hypothetical protein